MAKKFGSQIDLQKIPVVGLVPESGVTAPTSPTAGQLWLDTSVTPNRLKVYENGGWVLASQTGTVLTSTNFGGDVSGTYNNLQLGANVVTGSELADGAVTTSKITDGSVTQAKIMDSSVTGAKIAPTTITASNILGGTITSTQLSTDLFDADDGVSSLRKLGYSATNAMPGVARLDQIAAPTASVSLNSQKITGLATPTAASDAATKGYVDGVATGLDVKASVRVATTGVLASGAYNATGGTGGRGAFTSAPTSIDGVSLSAGDRVLVKNQATAAQNGIYSVTNAATGAWERASDFDADAEVTAGAFTFVEEGGTNADTGWVLTTNNPITVGGASGTALSWTQFSASSQVTYIAGDGMTQTGTSSVTFNVVGTANRITASADAIDIASTYVGQTSITTLGTIATGIWNGSTIAVANGGTGSTSAAGARSNLGATGKYVETYASAITAGTSTTITHSLGTQDVVVSFRDASTNAAIDFAWTASSTNAITFTPDVAVSANTIRVVVIG